MTVSGQEIDLTDLLPIHLVKASLAQDYIRVLETALTHEDGSPLFFVDDGETWTSTGVVDEAWNRIQEVGNFYSTPLMAIIERLFANGNGFRVWWADNDPLSFLRVTECRSLEETIRTITEQATRTDNIRIRHRNG